MWTILLTIGLKFLGWYLDFSKAKTEQKKAFLKFLEAMAGTNKSIMKLRKSYISQRKAALEKLKNKKGDKV